MRQGIVRIRVNSERFSRFLAACHHREIPLWGVEQQDKYACFWAFHRDIYTLKPLFRKYHMGCRIIGRKGLPFLISGIKKQAGFFAGMLLCFFLLHVSENYIWKIEISGNRFYTESDMLSCFQAWNHQVGMKKSDVQEESLELLIRNAFPGITWVSAAQNGSGLFVTVKEDIEKEAPEGLDDLGDLVAQENGIIASIVTRKGVPMVKEGDEVERGQVLISGTIEKLDDTGSILSEEMVAADGDVFLFRTISYDNQTPRRYLVKERETEKRSWGIAVFDKQFLLPNKKLANSFCREIPVLFFDIRLPVSVLEVRNVTFKEKEQKRSDSEGVLWEEQLLEQYLYEMEKIGVQIIEKNVKIGVNENTSYAKGTISIVEKTGQRQSIEQEATGEQTDS